MEPGDGTVSDTGEKSERDQRSIERRAAAAPARSAAERTATFRAAHADLLRRIERLERSNAELEAFGEALAHDLSEGVATIAFFADALGATLGSALDEEARRQLVGIEAGVERSQALISGALRAAERRGAEPAPVDTNDVLRDALASLRARCDLTGAKVTAEPLPSVSGQRPELIRLFQNILANAIRFRDPGRPPRIRVGARRLGRRWRFEITDNGIGIDHDAADAASAGSQTGIGLAICRRIVESHGGRLRLEPGPGRQGTTVGFDLPAVEASAS